MEFLSKYCLCLLGFLFAHISEARHLSERQSDAATRSSISLTQPSVTFVKPSNIDSVITRNNKASSVTRHVAADTNDTNDKAHMSLHTHSSGPETTNENVHHLGTRKGTAHRDISKNRNSGEVNTGPESTKYTREEQQKSHTQIDEYEARENNHNIIDRINKNEILKNKDVSSGSHTTVSQNEVNNVANHISANNKQANTQILKHLGITHRDGPPEKNIGDDFQHDKPPTVTVSDSIDKTDADQHMETWDNPKNVIAHGTNKIHTWNGDLDTKISESSHLVNRNPDITRSIQSQENYLNKHTGTGNAKEAKIQDSNLRSVTKDDDTVLPDNSVNTVAVKDDSSKLLRPKVTVFIDEKNNLGHTQRILASNGDGFIQSRPVHISDTSLDTTEDKGISSNSVGIRSDKMDAVKSKNDLPRQASVANDPNIDEINEVHNSRGTPPVAVLEKAHDNKMPLRQVIDPAETNTNILDNMDITDRTTADVPSVADAPEKKNNGPETTKAPIIRATEKTTPVYERTTEIDDNKSIKIPPTDVAPTVRKSEDVTPLDIFTSDITYQRFPQPMSLTTFKNKVLGKRLKKLYILEESEKKLFQHVRQLEAIYTIEDGTLYASFLFRFVYSRKCQEIAKFKLGNLVGNTDIAMFEKEIKDGKTERIMFFSERPEDYVFFMSCTDMKTSPYACRDSYYVTLDSTHDPPNQFPWADAAREMESKLSLTFEDPRFIFNFVLLPCARRSTTG